MENRIFSFILVLFLSLILSGCDFNLLGGNKSHIDQNYEPGKKTPSEPPTISSIADFTMDENDVQFVPFTINDRDTFLMCSSIFVQAHSGNNTLIDSSGLLVSGIYPNCILQIQPKSLQYGTSRITVSVYDFWTVASSSFQLNVQHVLIPGFFSIVNGEAQDRSVMLEWSQAAYMNGPSARYTVFYRPTGSTSPFLQITPVRSPYTVSGLTNGVSYDFLIRARNSVGYRDTAVVPVTPTRFKIFGSEFISGSTQLEISTGPNLNHALVNTTTGSKTDGVMIPATTPTGKYKVYLNSQGNILSGGTP